MKQTYKIQLVELKKGCGEYLDECEYTFPCKSSEDKE